MPGLHRSSVALLAAFAAAASTLAGCTSKPAAPAAAAAPKEGGPSSGATSRLVDEPAEAFKERIRAIMARDKEILSSAVSDPPTIEGLGDYPPILMRVVGHDFSELRREAQFLTDTMNGIDALRDVQLKDSPGKPELQIEVRREEAARVGLTAGAVAMQVRLATQGEIAGKLRDARREAEIRVRLAPEDRESTGALQRLWIATPRGPVSLEQLATLRSAQGPGVIEHEQRERQISVWAQVARGHDLGEATSSLIGLILLMGLVTKNAILLVDGALLHIREGDDPETAVRKAGPRRLRPILMTSGAMVLGMLPTALGRGMGSEFRSPMAIAVIGGVIISTLLTLWVVPVVFLWIERLRGGRGRGPVAVAVPTEAAEAVSRAVGS